MNRIKKYFITGILVVLPLWTSIYILYLIFNFIDGILGHIMHRYFDKAAAIYIPGLGFILFLFLITGAGFASIHFFGKGLHRAVESIVLRFPILRTIYTWINQSLRLLLSENQMAFKKAVLIEYPAKGLWSVGFIANETFKEASQKTQQELLNVFIPLAPNPISGFVALVPRKDVLILDVSVKEAMKLVVSAGLLNPG